MFEAVTKYNVEVHALEQVPYLLAQAFREATTGTPAPVSGAGQEVRKLAEAMSIPVAFSMDGKGLIPDNHPLSVGAVGTYCRPCANRAVSEADLVFFIGCGTGDQVNKNWTLSPAGTTVIQMEINAAEIGRNHPGALGIHGDARVSLEQLNQAVSNRVKKESWSRTV